MDIHASSVLSHPQARAYLAYRDELPAVAAYIPNVKQVIVQKREEHPGGVRLHNVWVGKGEIPKVAQAFIKPEMLAWDDYADWDDATHACKWTIRVRVFTEKVRCFGTTRIVAEGTGHSRVTLQGTLDLDLAEIPGVPRILARTIKPQVEAFIVSLIRPNLEQVNVALDRYLSAQPRA